VSPNEEHQLAQLKKATLKAAEVRGGGAFNDPIGRTQLIVLAMFFALTEEQKRVTIAQLEDWSTP
jgi:hypothetical protein